nr:MAG TPA: hypothetical protein [Caudoviricetes sp.]
MPDLEFFLQRNGISYSIERNDTLIHHSLTGVPNTETRSGKKYIGFIPGTDIQPNDVLTNPAGEVIYITDIQTQFIHQEPYQLKAYYQTKYEKACNTQSNSPVFNIGTAYGSVIGTQQSVTVNYKDSLHATKKQLEDSDSPDKEELQQIISLLEMMVNNQLPPQKGLLSKFSAVLERNSWITSPIASVLISWLTSQI